MHTMSSTPAANITTSTVADTSNPEQYPRSSPPIPKQQQPEENGNVSEAETEILSDTNKSVRAKKEITLENGRRRDDDDESPRKRRRRRSRSRSHGSGDEAEDTADLSSVSSRHASPPSRRKEKLDADGTRKMHTANAKKRKVRADSSSSEDEGPPPRTKLRQRRNSSALAPSHSRKASISSVGKRPPPSPYRASSPVRGPGRPRSTKARRPRPLQSTWEEDSSSSSSSRHGSPAKIRRQRSTVPTPGSPANMSHRAKRDTAGRTQLHRACQRGNLVDVEAIVSGNKELIHVDDHAGYLPIHEAALNGHLDVVKLLVDRGSKFDKRSTSDKETPLLDAVENGHVDVVEYLLGLGANPRKRDNRGRTPIDANREAWEEGNDPENRQELEDLLKAAMVNHQGNSANSGDEANERDSPSSASPRHESPSAQSVAPVLNRRRNARAEQSRKDLLWLDSGKGSVAKLRDKAREGDIQMVSALLETGLKPDREAMIGAIKGGHAEVVSLMLAFGAEADPVPGTIDRDASRRRRDMSLPAGEETPMLAAIGRGNVTILRYLLENGVDPRRLDSDGKSYPEIAKDRQGDDWQEEVKLLKEYGQRAGGKRPPVQSPQRLKSSPAKSKQARRSSSTNSRIILAPPKEKPKRSISARPANHLDDSAVASDRESTAEPYLLGKISKRSESESVAPSSPKRRRRLVSGKVREEEMAKAGGSDAEKKPVRPEKLGPKEDKDTKDRPKKVKNEPTEEAKVEDVPPLDRRKLKPDRDREKDRDRPKAATEPPRRPGRPPTNRERSRSPPRSAKMDAEKSEQLRKRRREESNERPTERRPSESALRHVREEKRARAAEGRPDRPKEELRRRDGVPVKVRTGDDPRKEERKKRRDKVANKSQKVEAPKVEALKVDTPKNDTPKAESPKQTTPEAPTEPDDDKEDKERERKDRESQEEAAIADEAREVLRRKHLIRELKHIQQKAQAESKVDQQNQIIVRELALRRIREEEERKQRIALEEEEREQEAREAQEKVEREAREAREAEEHRLAKQEAIEREAREKVEAERLAKEREERERVELAEREEKERQDRERQEREMRESEARRVEETRTRELERRRKEEEDRLCKIEEEKAAELAAEREEQRLKEEAEKQRLEQERIRIAKEEEKKRKAEEDERQRFDLERQKAAEEIAAHEAAESARLKRIEEEASLRRREADRIAQISSLPTTLRQIAEREQAHQPPPRKDYWTRFVEILTVEFPAPKSSSITNGTNHNQYFERWMSNVQAACILNTGDLSLPSEKYPELKSRRETSEHERVRIWQCQKPMLMKELLPDDPTPLEVTMQEQMRDKERWRRLRMEDVFWIKVGQRPHNLFLFPAPLSRCGIPFAIISC